MENYKESEWTKFSDIEKELKAVEANIAAEFWDSNVSLYGESVSDREKGVNSLYCIVCNKVFKTERAFSNHENSKNYKDSGSFESIDGGKNEMVASGNKQKIKDLSYECSEITSVNELSSDSDISS
jgi:tRNA U34 2-thiouridine synthase MnmA/TrmU